MFMCLFCVLLGGGQKDYVEKVYVLFPSLTTPGFVKSNAGTNGRRTAVQIGGALRHFPFFKA